MGLILNNFKILFLITSLFFSFSSCTLTDKSAIPKSYSKNPKKVYELALKRMKTKDWEDARTIFGKIKKAFPLSEYATLADLRIADCHVKENSFATAASLYHDFMKDYPFHEAVKSGYTTWKIGYCQYRLGPGDFFIFPPSYEKDLTHTRSAMKIFKIFIKRYPDSSYLKSVKKYHMKAVEKLADHEMYVASYYTKKGKTTGVRMRYEFLLSNYPESKRIHEAVIKLAEIYIKEKTYLKARTLLSEFIKKYPGSKNLMEAKKLLSKIPGEKK